MKQLITLIGILFLTASCQKSFLKEENIAGVTYDYYSTPQGFVDGVNSVYDNLRPFFGNGVAGVRPELGMYLSEIGTDTFTGASYFVKALAFDQYTDFTDQDVQLYLYDLMQIAYKSINTCNILIAVGNDIPPSATLSTAQKNIKLAEARFLRAINYFYLVQTFGKVPLLLQPNLVPTTEFTRASVADIYAAIITDLTIAANTLPSQAQLTNYGFATKGAAQHFLAKVYLTRGSAVTEQRGQKTTDMDSCAYWADKVINEGPYTLVPKVEDLWDFNKQINSELIFSVTYSVTSRLNGTASSGEGNQLHQWFLATYATQKGMKEDFLNGRALGRVKPTDYLYDVYDRKSDSRFYKLFKTAYICNNADAGIPKWEKNYTPAGKTVGNPKYVVGDTAVLFSMYNLPVKTTDAIYKTKPYIWITRQNFSSSLYLSLIKYQDPIRVDGTIDPKQQRGGRDVFVARLAETYLIAAEAYARKSAPDYSKAATYINAVRTRAAYKDGESRPGEVFTTEGESSSENKKSSVSKMLITAADINSAAKAVNFILDERARELCGELQRWFDLTRNEKLSERVALYNKASGNIKDFHRFRPIPQLYLDLITNKGPDQQNTGY